MHLGNFCHNFYHMETSPTQPKSFLSIFLKTLTYIVLSFVIIYSFIVANIEYSIYKTVPPKPPVYEPEVPTPLTEAEKEDIAQNLNYSDTKSNPADAAQKLNAIPKSKSTLTDEEKNKILEGLE